MTKVKVDVQLLVTGGVGDGKTAITHRILKAIQADQGLQSICKLHPGQSYEILRGELTRLTFTGELMQNAEMKKPPEIYSAIPGYPNTDAMLSYLISAVNETELSKDPKAHAEALELSEACVKPAVIGHIDKSGNRTEYKPFKVVIDTVTGEMVEWRAGEKLSTRDRVITMLADVGASAVGMHQDDAQTAETQGSAATLAGFGVDMNTPGREGLGYATRCASVSVPPKAESKPTTIELTKTEIQSGVSRVRWAEGLIRQLPTNHEGRNSWLLNYGTMTEQEAKDFETRMKSPECAASNESVTILDFEGNKGAAPKPDAHKYPLAVATLESLIQGFASQFKEHNQVLNSKLMGEFWVIFSDGALVPVDNFIFHNNGASDQIPVFYAERECNS